MDSILSIGRIFILLGTISTSFAGSACKTKVYNRGVAPDSFLKEEIAWAKTAPDVVFAKNNNYDVYSLMAPKLGPYRDLKHRKAVMLEVLRVLGGYESSWDWTEGVDVTNSSSLRDKCKEEAGIFQTSANSMAFDMSLKLFFKNSCSDSVGTTDCKKFISCSKAKDKHPFAIEYTARLLRYTVKHHGPLIRKSDVYKWTSQECVKEFEKEL